MDKNDIKILVIDDEDGILYYLKKILEHRGYQVFDAKESDTALEIFDREKPHISIIDVFLVDSTLDGIQILSEFLRRDKNAFCMMLSRIDEDATKEKAMDVGAKKYLEKPLEPEDLISVVEDAARKVGL